MTKTRRIVLLLLFVMLLLPATALAFTARSGNSVNIAKGETVDGNFYASGQNIQIEGKVSGDVICAGQSININGEVAGDVICVGQSVIVNGKVGGSLRAAANAVILNGQVGRNLTAAAASISTGASSTVGWEALTAAASADLRGRIGRDLVGAGASYVLGGEIGRNVRLWVDSQDKNELSLKVENGARVGGQLIYTARQDAEINKGAKIAGEIKRNEPKVRDYGKRQAGAGWLFGAIYSIFAALLIGLVLISVWPETIKQVIGKLLERSGAAIGWGLVILIMTPIVCLLLLITLIGAPLALVLGMVWLISLIISKIFVAILVGQKLTEKFWQAKKDSLYAALIVGAVVSYLAFAIPVLGWLASAVAMIAGLGAIFLYFKKA